ECGPTGVMQLFSLRNLAGFLWATHVCLSSPLPFVREGSMSKTRGAPVEDKCINISFPDESYRDMVYVVTVTPLAFVRIAVCVSLCSVHFKLLLICAYTPRYASSIQERLDEWSQPREDVEFTAGGEDVYPGGFSRDAEPERLGGGLPPQHLPWCVAVPGQTFV
ncbi:MAG: hypothetical protein ACOVQL_08495, partial [Limnohabitans sp.]